MTPLEFAGYVPAGVCAARALVAVLRRFRPAQPPDYAGMVESKLW